MKMGRVCWAMILVVAVVASGCAGRPAGPSGQTESKIATSSTPASASGTNQSTGNPIPKTNSALRWNDCVGLGSLFTGPAATAPTGSEVPPGWAQTTGDISSMQINTFHCNRVSIGPFERPVTGMTESHNKITVPPQCIAFNPDIIDVDVLVALWVDDAQVAGYLHSTYGMPVRIAKFDYAADTTTPVEQRTWSWSSDNSTPSRLTMPFVPGSNTPGSFTLRMMWHNGTAVSALDYSEVSTVQNNVDALASYGLLQPPMLYARTAPFPYVGRADTWTGDITGTIYRFGDLECKKPL